MAASKATDERAIAERVAKGKAPEKALKRAFPDREAGEVLWGWLAEGIVPMSGALGALAGQLAQKVPVEELARAAMRLPRHPLRVASMAFAVRQSYRARAAEWEAQLDALPREVQLLLLVPRAYADVPSPPPLRDEAVAIYASAVVDGDHDHTSEIAGFASSLGVDADAFARMVVARLEAERPASLGPSGNLVAPLAKAPWSLARSILAT